MKVRKIVIPVAGMGTRFLPATKVIAKEITGFLGARIFSFLVEEGGMLLFISVLGFGEKSLTVLGITMRFNILQLRNPSQPMDFISTRDISFKEVHPSKA